MRTITLLLPLLLLVGCKTPLPIIKNENTPAVAARKPHPDTVYTCYELGAYAYPKDANAAGERAIYRGTRVPPTKVSSKSSSLESGRPPSFAPLSASAELAAELAAQRELTRRLRDSQQSLVSVERLARQQYGALLAQSEQTARVKAELESERDRMRIQVADTNTQSPGDRAAAKDSGTWEPTQERAVSTSPSW